MRPQEQQSAQPVSVGPAVAAARRAGHRRGDRNAQYGESRAGAMSDQGSPRERCSHSAPKECERRRPHEPKGRHYPRRNPEYE